MHLCKNISNSNSLKVHLYHKTHTTKKVKHCDDESTLATSIKHQDLNAYHDWLSAVMQGMWQKQTSNTHCCFSQNLTVVRLKGHAV